VPLNGWLLYEEFWGHHVECSVGNAVANSEMVTPYAMANRPYLGGNQTMNISYLAGPDYTFDSGGLRVTTPLFSPMSRTNYAYQSVVAWGNLSFTNESYIWTVAVYWDFNWTIYSVKNVSVFTSNPSEPCTQAYVAMVANEGAFMTSGGSQVVGSLPLQNSTTDASEGHYLPSNNLSVTGDWPSIWYNNSFYGSNRPTIDTCNQSNDTVIKSYGWVYLPIAVTLRAGGHNVTAYGSLGWSGGPSPSSSNPATMTYVFPAHGGIWKVYSIPGSGNPGALAFQYYSC
jgi:hypothetical protein